MSDNIPDKEIRQVVEKIFYSPATNGKAEQSINDGIEAVDKLFEAARHHLSPVDSLKNFDVLLRAYMDRKLHEAGVRMPNEFWETIQKDEAIEYLKIPISEHPSSLRGDGKAICSICGDEIEHPLCINCDIQLTLPTNEY